MFLSRKCGCACFSVVLRGSRLGKNHDIHVEQRYFRVSETVSEVFFGGIVGVFWGIWSKLSVVLSDFEPNIRFWLFFSVFAG